MLAKAVAAAVSMLLVVGVIIGVVISVGHHGTSHNSDNSGDAQISSGMKAVKTICAPTDFKEACERSLGPLAKNGTTNPQELIKAAVQATMDEVAKSLQHSQKINIDVNNATQKMAVDDCKELLELAIDELQAAMSTVGDTEVHTMNERVADLLNWLSAVISYQQTCIDGFQKPELKSAMQGGLVNATQLTSNALAIITEISNVLSGFKIQIPQMNGNSRRLLGTTEVDKQGYPTWMSGADRRLLASGAKVVPNAIVAKDGSGQFKSIAAALAAFPKGHRGRYVIYVKAGIYNEYITVQKDQVNIFMYGDGPRNTIVTGKLSFTGGVSTYKTASFSVIGNGFICKGMGFQNTAGPEGHQAVALRVQSDFSAFYNCRMDGYQDTLYVQAKRQFYRNCVISGTVDFIFGDSTVVIQNSLIIVRKPMQNQQNIVTAHGRSEKRETTGLVIHNCRIVPEEKLFADRFTIPSYLGRPWKEYSRTVIMESTIGDFIQPAGWMPWAGDFALNTLYYAEYANRGPGAGTGSLIQALCTELACLLHISSSSSPKPPAKPSLKYSQQTLHHSQKRGRNASNVKQINVLAKPNSLRYVSS